MTSTALLSALYWDITARDGAVHTQGTLISDVSPDTRENLLLILQLFGSVTTLSTKQRLAGHLFAYEKHFLEPLIIFVADDSGSTILEIVKFISGQMAHIPGILVVLSPEDSDYLYQLGVNKVVAKRITLSDVQKIATSAFKLRHILHHRTEEVKGLVGLVKNELIPLGSRFPFAYSEVECKSQMVEPIYPRRLSAPSLAPHPSAASSFIRSPPARPHHDLYHQPPSIPHIALNVPENRAALVRNQIGDWNFDAQELSYDELLFAAFLIIKHAFSTKHVAPYVISDDRLLSFLFVIRNCYHKNPYHNFRHAVDVIQATFHFLLSIGALPQLAESSRARNKFPNKLVPPIEALALLIGALGHDAGHPGVTNAFLVSMHAPLAKLYHDRSVLEFYHSSTLVHILWNMWPEFVKEEPLRDLIIVSVLATDMGMHFDYMDRLQSAIAKIEEQNGRRASAPSASVSSPTEITTLLCCALMKCADISNVARKLDISLRWGAVLADEFSVIGELETEYGLQNQVLTEKRKGALEEGQIFFVQTYALPLFTAICKIFPKLRYTLEQIDENTLAWQERMAM